MSVLPMFAVLFGLIAFELPIAFALIASALAWLQFASPVPMSLVVQRMTSGVDSVPLLAIPLFAVADDAKEKADAKANARTPPSRSASVFSKACRVGLPVRA
jgi:TRAP-type mannitol/chloroaromatic compound transport system permease large subunit